jgi:hypothetical protein
MKKTLLMEVSRYDHSHEETKFYSFWLENSHKFPMGSVREDLCIDSRNKIRYPLKRMKKIFAHIFNIRRDSYDSRIN